MARAVSSTEDATPGEEMIEGAGDAMLLMVSRSMVETLNRQALSEGVSMGRVLDKAMRAYLKEHGSPEAVAYLIALDNQQRRPR